MEDSREISEEKKMDKEERRKGKISICKDLFIVAIGWFLNMAAYNAVEVLQSSLNDDNGMGVKSLAVINTLRALSCLVAPYIIVKLTPKWTMTICYAAHLLFIIANYFPSFWTLLTAATLVGAAVGPMWICYGIYVTLLALRYSKLSNKDRAKILGMINGLCSTCIPASFAFGNLITSVLLNSIVMTPDSLPAANGTVLTFNSSAGGSSNLSMIVTYTESPYYETSTHSQNDSYHEVCGLQFCPAPEGQADSAIKGAPSAITIYIWLSCLVLCSVSSVVITAIFLAHLTKEEISSRLDTKEKLHRQLLKYFRTFFHWKFLLLAPGIAYVHVSLPLFFGMFSRAYVACMIGISSVGLMGLTYSVCATIGNILMALASRFIHRNYQFIIGFVVYSGIVVLFFVWDSHDLNDQFMLFFIPAVGGIANGFNFNLLFAFIGIAFPDTAAQAFSFLEFTAGIITALEYLAVHYLCVKYQIWIIIGLMISAVIGFVILNILLHKESQALKQGTKDTEKQPPEGAQDDAGSTLLNQSNTAIEVRVPTEEDKLAAEETIAEDLVI